jgi:uncharacterized membrane protein YfcA
MIVSGFTLGAISVIIGFAVRFTRHGPFDHVYAYLLVAAGVILVFVSSLARRSRRNSKLLRYVLAALTALLLVGLLLKDALQRMA